VDQILDGPLPDLIGSLRRPIKDTRICVEEYKNDDLILAYSENQIKVFEIKTGKMVNTLRSHFAIVNTMVIKNIKMEGSVQAPTR